MAHDIPGEPFRSIDLSPANWDKAARERAEALERTSFQGAPETVTLSGKGGVVSATVSPLAVRSGIETLARGGNAADAAITTALTGVATALGAYVSYAGIVSLVYYEARSGKVHAMDAGFNSYLGEDDAMSIPDCDFAGKPLPIGKAGTARENLGRKTLVPGYMAGLESMHRRFGSVKFADLFAPAIWYAEEGLELDPWLANMFQRRAQYLDRTEEGRGFFYNADGALPVAGERFRQPETARTLRAVASEGAAYMYTGAWAEEFVRIVRREGGKVTMEDMGRYQPTWMEPLSGDFYGAEVHTVDTSAGVQILSTLAVIEAAGLDRKPPYWEDPQAFIDLSRAAGFAFALRGPKPSLAEALAAQGVILDPAKPLTKAQAARAAAAVMSSPPATPQDRPSHSDSVVVIDKDGNVAAMTHTINCVIWGDTAIVVGGVPLPDAAGFQQAALAAIRPGERLPNPISPIIAFKDGKPALAAGQIGSCLVPETLRLMLGLFGQGQDLAALQARPPLLLTFPGTAPDGEKLEGQLTLPEGRYGDDFLDGLKAAGATVHMMPPDQARGMRGTVVTARLNPATGEPETCEAEGTYVRAEALRA